MAGYTRGMALERAVAGTLTHAELVDFVVRQVGVIDQQQATIAEWQALNARLEARIRDLERELAQRDKNDPAKRMPGLKPATPPRRAKQEPPKRRTQGFSRARSEPTERVEHAVDVCPQCMTPLSGGWVRWRKEVLEVVPSSARVVEHVYLARRCSNTACRTGVTPPPASAAELGVVGARQRLGIHLVSLIATLRAELRLPIAQIQWYLGTVHRLELNEGAISDALSRVSTAGVGAVGRILEQVRASPVVCADETGLRQNGANGYLWGASTERERYFLHGRRDKAMVDAILGPDFAGVLVTDFYAAYDHYAGPHQRCWAHLLREVKALVERNPHDAVLGEWAIQVHGVYQHAKRFSSLDAVVRERAQRRFEAEILAVCQPYLEGEPARVPQAVLCRRIQKYLPELFTFVADLAVPSTNNAAERSVRAVVVQRKISGGTRSARGTESFTALATLFGTWRARGLDPLVACRQMLLAPSLVSPV